MSAYTYDEVGNPQDEEQVEKLRSLAEALRSGKYKQVRGALRVTIGDKGDYHCCLGVACDIFEPKAWAEADDPNDDALTFWELAKIDFDDYMDWEEGTVQIHAANETTTMLPQDVYADLGVTGTMAYVWKQDQWGNLTDEARKAQMRAPMGMRMWGSCMDMNDGEATFEDIADVIDYVLNTDGVYFAKSL